MGVVCFLNTSSFSSDDVTGALGVHTNSRLKGKKGPPARGAAPKGLGGVFHKTRLSDIPRQRLHKAINCLASAQPTNAALQSLTRLHKLRRLAELRKSPGLPSPSADRPAAALNLVGIRRRE